MTCRELVVSYRAHLEQAWDHTANVLCMLHNVNSKRQLPPNDFHPLRRRRVTLREVGIDYLMVLAIA